MPGTVEFFYPGEDEQGGEEWLATVRDLQDLPLTDRRIARLRWRDVNERREVTARVGAPGPYGRHDVLVILECVGGSGAKYLVCTVPRGIAGMPPFQIGSAEEVEFFDRWDGEQPPPHRRYGFVLRLGHTFERVWEERIYAPPMYLRQPGVELEGRTWRVLGRHTPADADTPEPWVYDCEPLGS